MTDLNSQILGTKPRKNASQYQRTIITRVPSAIRDGVADRAQRESMSMSTWIRRVLEAKLRRKA
jgi:predicted HicB family RNase H-like nuclease